MTEDYKMKMQYKWSMINKAGRTFFYDSYDEALKMARFCGLGMSAVKEIHLF